jgi:four helix bundle protein
MRYVFVFMCVIRAVGGRRRAEGGSHFKMTILFSFFSKFNMELLLSNLNRCIMSHFEELKVWQKAVDLAVKVYEITKNEPFKKDYGLRDQMRRSSVSISSNISEGDQLDSDKSSIRHFRIAKGSTAELFTQSIISDRIGYLNKNDFEYLKKECQEILAMLTNLIKHRNLN